MHDCSVTFPICYKDVYVNSFFPRTAIIWNSLPAECFPLTFDLNGFKSRVNKQLFSLGSLYIAFLYDVHLFLLFLVTPSPHSGCLALHGVQFNFKKNGWSPSVMSSRIVVLDWLNLFGFVDSGENTLHRLQTEARSRLRISENPDPIFADHQNKRTKVGRTYKNWISQLRPS